MASVKDFCAQLEELDSVNDYLLLAADGRLVAHTMLDSEQIGSLITLTMLSAENIGSCTAAGRLHNIAIGLSEDNCLIIFALGKWILAIQKQSHSTNTDLCKQVESVINNFRNT